MIDYANLYGLLGGDNSSAYPLDDSAKRRLFKQGLLEFAANVARPNGGNLMASITSGLLAAKRGGQEGAAQYANDAYRGDIMARTRAQMDANTRLEQAKAAVLGPDGQLDEAKFRQYAVIDPQGAKALRDAIAPRMEYDIQNIDGQLYYVPKDPQVAPMQQDAPIAGPAFPVQGKDLYASIGDVIKPFGGRVTSTNGGKHNPGSLHYSGRAVDVGMAQESPERQQQIIGALEAAGYKVRDERQRPAGQAVWGGPHVHVEAGQQVA